MIWICKPLAFILCPRPFCQLFPLLAADPDNALSSGDNNRLVHIRLVYAVIGVVKANVKVRGHLSYPAFHVFIFHFRERKKFLFFLHPVVIPVMRLLLERGMV